MRREFSIRHKIGMYLFHVLKLPSLDEHSYYSKDVLEG